VSFSGVVQQGRYVVLADWSLQNKPNRFWWWEQSTKLHTGHWIDLEFLWILGLIISFRVPWCLSAMTVEFVFFFWRLVFVWSNKWRHCWCSSTGKQNSGLEDLKLRLCSLVYNYKRKRLLFGLAFFCFVNILVFFASYRSKPSGSLYFSTFNACHQDVIFFPGIQRQPIFYSKKYAFYCLEGEIT